MDRFRIHGAALTAADLDSVPATPKAVLPTTVVSYNFNETQVGPSPAAGTQALPAVPNPAPKWTSDTPSWQDERFCPEFCAWDAGDRAGHQ